tara:strand:- start:1819 stop:2007 length:189 start_codon:yes stop_codon:yes gene_type:complete
MKNLQNYGVQEMNAEEIREIDGGNWLKALRVFAAAAAAIHETICSGPESHRTSFHAMDRGAW